MPVIKRFQNGLMGLGMKTSAKEEIEKLRRFAEEAATLRQQVDEMQKGLSNYITRLNGYANG